MRESGSDSLLIFLHIPRTGGTTFRQILFRQYGEKRVFRLSIPGFDPGEISRSVSEVPEGRWDSFDVFTSHVGYGIQELIPRHSESLTFLRHPLNRVVSFYQPIIASGKWSDVPARQSLALDNEQTRMLWGGVQEVPFGECTTSMLEEAKRNLSEGLKAFGLQERYEESLLLFQDQFGWKIPFHAREHKGVVPGIASRVPEDVRAQILQHNQLDLELYRYATEVFEERISRKPGNFPERVHRFRMLNGPYDVLFRGLRSVFRTCFPKRISSGR